MLLLFTSVKRKLLNTVLLLHCAVTPVIFFLLLVKLAKRQLKTVVSCASINFNVRHGSQNRVAARLGALSICIAGKTGESFPPIPMVSV